MLHWGQWIHGSDESGQALIEFVLILPVLLVVLIGVFQLALICEAKLLTHMAVRHAAQIHLEGGSQRVMQREISQYFQQYPLMNAESVQVSLVQSPMMTTVKVSCKPPVVKFLRHFGKVPTLTASMSLGREFFDLSRILDIRNVIRFREYLKGAK